LWTKPALSLNDPVASGGGLPGLEPGAGILILRLRSLGDLVLTTPALAALHAWRPDLRLAVLVEPAFRAVFEGHPAVEETICTDGFAGTARALRRRRFSMVFNQHGGPRSAFLAAASGAPVRVAWSGSQFSFLYHVLVPGPEAFYGPRPVHSVEHRMTQFYWLGLPRTPIPPAKLYPQPDAASSVEKKLEAQGLAPGRPYAVLQPGAAFATRRWPLEHFALLAAWLAAEWKLAPVVLLGPGEQEFLAEARRLFDPPAVVVEGLDLRQLIALISSARLFVGHDTGPTHVAAAVRCPVVAIFGSSSPAIWRPWATPSRVVLNEFSCRPCPGDRCYAFDRPRCILSVTPEQVREACGALLAETDETVPGLRNSLRKES
jgi:lipopolysaccharide heptosyltransferase III